MNPAVKTIADALLALYGDEWFSDDDANARFVAETQLAFEDVEGAHMIGEPELEDGRIEFNLWVDEPIEDILAADQLAFDLFSRISEEIFYTERVIKQRTVDYPFVTGSDRHGHMGAIVLSGPHASDFAQRHHLRTTGSQHFHA
jgi:hypothetical protein